MRKVGQSNFLSRLPKDVAQAHWAVTKLPSLEGKFDAFIRLFSELRIEIVKIGNFNGKLATQNVE